MTFLDEHTHFGVIYFLKSKDQAFDVFKHYVVYAERETRMKLRTIRTDNGGEYTSQAWLMYCSALGIRHSKGPPHSPQLHGVAERFNQTLLDKILPSLFHEKLPTSFWEASTHHAVMSYNLTPTRSNPVKASPETLWRSQLTSYSSICAFRCKGFRKITGPSYGGKLASKSSPCLHLYTLPDGDGWMMWDIQMKKKVKSHNVVFYENEFPGLGLISKKTRKDWFTWSMDHCDRVANDNTQSRLRAL